jgi:hypothetical protein
MARTTFRLPAPDRFGNYWLGRRTANPGEPCDPAIFPSKRLDHMKEEVHAVGAFILFLGSDRGFLFAGPVLRLFKTPAAALDFLNE